MQHIHLSRVQVSLGYYEKEMDAARAYDAESLRLRGPNGHINLPESRALLDAHSPDDDAGTAFSAGQLSPTAPFHLLSAHFRQHRPLESLELPRQIAAGGDTLCLCHSMHVPCIKV